MKEINVLSNVELVSKLKSLIKTERDLVVEILWHLHEVEFRRIHLDSGFPSLFEYCTRELGYSAGAAARRIASMRLLQELPELEPKIRAGELQLSQLAQAQLHFRQEAKGGRTSDSNQKREVLQTLEGKSSRETERILVGLNPLNAPAERERILSKELTEIRFVAGSGLMKKIAEAKLRYSHALPQVGYAELFERLLDEALKKSRAASADALLPDAALRPAPELEKSAVSRARKAIPAATRRAVFERAGRCCEYQDKKSGKRCSSGYQLEIDHRIPLAKGGSDHPDNLQLLCRAHNRRAAEMQFGRELMSRYCG